MCEIKKILFSVSEQGNPLAQLWVDDADVDKNSDCIYIALKSQVAYLFFSELDAKITLKKSKQYYNVEVPDSFKDIFENYKTSTNNTVKIIGAWMNNAFNNFFTSMEFIKNGKTVKISQEEADAKCLEYMEGYTHLYSVALDSLSKSKVKALKAVSKILDKEDSKASDIKEAHNIVNQFTTLLSREVIAKNNFVIEVKEEEKPKKTKEKETEELEEIPF